MSPSPLRSSSTAISNVATGGVSHAPITIRQNQRCLRCQYLRTGIDRLAPCPECGEPAPPLDTLVLHGWTTEAQSLVNFLAVGAILLGAGLLLALIAWFTRSPGAYTPSVAAIIAGSAISIRGAIGRLRNTTGDGGDVAWVIGPDRFEARLPMGTARLSWDDVDSALYAYGWRRGSVVLSVLRYSVGQAPEANIWVNERDVDTRAVHALLRERIAEAAHRRAAAPPGAERDVNPPGAPPPGPS